MAIRGDFEPTGGQGGPIGDALPGAPPAPAAPAAPVAPAPAVGAAPAYDPNDPAFRALPRELQRQIESGAMNIMQATKQAGAAGGQQAGKSPPQAPQPTPLAAGVGKNINQQAKPATVPGLTNENRLSAGDVLGGGKMGVDTFSRKGTGGNQAFQGREFGGNLGAASAAPGMSAADALRFGNVGRGFTFGGGGQNGGGDTNQLLQQLFGQQ